MRILQVHSPYLRHGGEDSVVKREAEVLRNAGHEVQQHLVPNPGRDINALGPLLGAVWNPKSFFSAGRLVATHHPDIAHVHNTWFALSPSMVAGLRRLAVPVVVTLHNYRLTCVNGLLYRAGQVCTLCVGRSPLPGISYCCYRNSIALSTLAAANITVNRSIGTWDHVDLFIAMTDFSREVLVRGGIPAKRIAVKPHFVPDPGQRPAPPSESKIVLYVGRISEEKGLGMLLEAWKAASLYDLELVIIGEGPLRETLQQEPITSVRFMGELGANEVGAWMLQARALVFPSQWLETFGLVLAEALAAGVPVLASDIGGTHEVLADLGSDWLVGSTTVAAWSDALKRIQNDHAVDEGGRVARASYLKRYSPGVGLMNLEDIYRKVLDAEHQ